MLIDFLQDSVGCEKRNSSITSGSQMLVQSPELLGTRAASERRQNLPSGPGPQPEQVQTGPNDPDRDPESWSVWG